MLQKIFTFITRYKSCPCICFNLFDLAELFFQVWSNREIILIAIVALWIPALKLGVFIYGTFGIKVKYILPKKHYKEILYCLFTIAAIGSVLHLAEKFSEGISLHNFAVLVIAYGFVLYMDFLETREVIHRLNEDSK